MGGRPADAVRRRRDRLEQLADGDGQRTRESHQDIGTGIGLAQLDPSYVLVIQTGQLRQSFLCDLAIQPETTELRAERPQHGWTRWSFVGGCFPAGHTVLCTARPWPEEPSIDGADG